MTKSVTKRGAGLRGTAATLGLIAALAVGVALPAAAATPTNLRVPLDEEFVDEGASAICGFPVTVELSGFAVMQVLSDSAGEPSRLRIVVNRTGTISANGISLPEADHTVILIDVADQTHSEIGIIFRVSVPGGGVILFDRGRLVFDESTETLAFEAGPHPALHGDLESLCAALTP